MLLQGLKIHIKRILGLGVEEKDNSRFARNIRSTNFAVLLAFVCCLPASVFNVLNDTETDQLILFIYAISNAFILFLNYRRSYNLSRVLLVLGGNIILFYFSDVLGKETGIPLYFFMMVVLPYLIFEFEEWKFIAFLNFTTVLFFIILEYNDYNFFPFDHHKADADMYVDFRYNVTFVFISLIATLIFFSSEFYKTEQGYFEKLKALKFSESLTNTIIEVNNDAIWILDEKFRLINSNESLRSFFKNTYNIDLKKGFDITNDTKDIFPDMLDVWKKYNAVFKDHYKKAFSEGTFKVFDRIKINGYENYFEINLYRIINSDGSRIIVVFSKNITEQKIAEQKIKGNLNEKILLLKEVHHRVKNNLQIIIGLLQLQELYIVDPDSKKAFKQSEDRIKAMALVHELLYQTDDLSKVNFGDYIGRISTSLLKSYVTKNQNISMNINCKNIFLPIDIAIPLGLIFNELMTNALKYAFLSKGSGEIKIQLHKIQLKKPLIIHLLKNI